MFKIIPFWLQFILTGIKKTKNSQINIKNEKYKQKYNNISIHETINTNSYLNTQNRKIPKNEIFEKITFEDGDMEILANIISNEPELVSKESIIEILNLNNKKNHELELVDESKIIFNYTCDFNGSKRTDYHNKLLNRDNNHKNLIIMKKSVLNSDNDWEMNSKPFLKQKSNIKMINSTINIQDKKSKFARPPFNHSKNEHFFGKNEKYSQFKDLSDLNTRFSNIMGCEINKRNHLKTKPSTSSMNHRNSFNDKLLTIPKKPKFHSYDDIINMPYFSNFICNDRGYVSKNHIISMNHISNSNSIDVVNQKSFKLPEEDINKNAKSDCFIDFLNKTSKISTISEQNKSGHNYFHEKNSQLHLIRHKRSFTNEIFVEKCDPKRNKKGFPVSKDTILDNNATNKRFPELKGGLNPKKQDFYGHGVEANQKHHLGYEKIADKNKKFCENPNLKIIEVQNVEIRRSKMNIDYYKRFDFIAQKIYSKIISRKSKCDKKSLQILKDTIMSSNKNTYNKFRLDETKIRNGFESICKKYLDSVMINFFKCEKDHNIYNIDNISGKFLMWSNLFILLELPKTKILDKEYHELKDLVFQNTNKIELIDTTLFIDFIIGLELINYIIFYKKELCEYFNGNLTQRGEDSNKNDSEYKLVNLHALHKIRTYGKIFADE